MRAASVSIGTVFLATVLASSFSVADTVVLKTGAKIQGKVQSETDEKVVILSDGIAWTYLRAKVASVTHDDKGSAVAKALPPPQRRASPPTPSSRSAPASSATGASSVAARSASPLSQGNAQAMAGATYVGMKILSSDTRTVKGEFGEPDFTDTHRKVSYAAFHVNDSGQPVQISPWAPWLLDESRMLDGLGLVLLHASNWQVARLTDTNVLPRNVAHGNLKYVGVLAGRLIFDDAPRPGTRSLHRLLSADPGGGDGENPPLLTEEISSASPILIPSLGVLVTATELDIAFISMADRKVQRMMPRDGCDLPLLYDAATQTIVRPCKDGPTLAAQVTANGPGAKWTVIKEGKLEATSHPTAAGGFLFAQTQESGASKLRAIRLDGRDRGTAFEVTWKSVGSPLVATIDGTYAVVNPPDDWACASQNGGPFQCGAGPARYGKPPPSLSPDLTEFHTEHVVGDARSSTVSNLSVGSSAQWVGNDRLLASCGRGLCLTQVGATKANDKAMVADTSIRKFWVRQDGGSVVVFQNGPKANAKQLGWAPMSDDPNGATKITPFNSGVDEIVDVIGFD